MIKTIKYKPVNWVDGMRLSSEQFVANDKYYQDKMRDAISTRLNGYNYGVLPCLDTNTRTFAVEITASAAQMVDIRVRSCHAITADGCRIHIDAGPDGRGNVGVSYYFNEISATGSNLYNVLLQVDPFERVPEGEINPDNEPARHPYVGPSYKILVVPETNLPSEHIESRSLTVGRFALEQGSVVVNERYIPPCTSMMSHPLLIKYYELFSTTVHKLQSTSFSILDKTVNDSSITALARNLRMVTERILEYLAHHIFTFRYQLRQGTPLDFLGFFCHLSQTLFTGMRCIATKEREDLLKYFYEWRDISPASFEELLARVMEMKYNHWDIYSAFALTEEFLVEITALWERLAALEYIGQHKENIVVAEQQQVQQVQTRKIWTLLD